MIKFLKKILSYEIIPETEDKTDSELAKKIFERAMQEKASEILFGVPHGQESDKKENYIFNQSPDDEVREFAQSQGLEIKEPEKIEISAIPIYMKIDDKWHEVFDLPMSLHSFVIGTIKDYAEEFSLAKMHIRLPLETGTASFIFDTNENHNYLASELKFNPK